MFFYKVQGHMPKLSSFGRGKTIWPKKSLTSLLHAALHILSDFLGHIVFPRPNELKFCMWPTTS